MYLIRIKGIVQGVGFRPFICSKCSELGLKGYVRNTGSGVEVVVDDKERFLPILKELPPLARVDSCEINKVPGECNGFSIKKSAGRGFAEIPYDSDLCRNCLDELQDKKNRRHAYFFITCTDCGPRFSIMKRSPYDRKNTSMGSFKMCPECEKEYLNTKGRRYHAETIACEKCGPKICLYSDGLETGGIKEAAELLKTGEILAIKGVGGFHLACKIESAKRLRRITGRKNKPYALMARDIGEIEKIALIGKLEKKALLSNKRPILVLTKKDKKALMDISELDSIGVMLPYTALHYLLFEHLKGPLIMTSSNLPARPITSRMDEQFVRNVLSHDREIVNPLDDSVVKVVGEKTLLLRRSRGYVPEAIPLKAKKEGLCLGAEENASVCIVKDGKAVLSQYLGDTSVLETYDAYKEKTQELLELFDCSPEFIACDLNPSFNTSLYGKELSKGLGVPLIKVQHHLAHVFSVAGENGLDEFIGIACDGFGLGLDGSAWGGEVLLGKERIGGLEKQSLLGGDSAALHPKRMLFSVLQRFLEGDALVKASGIREKEASVLSNILEKRFNCLDTSSCGRVLDAVSAFLGFCEDRAYQGRAAMLLESKSSKPYFLEPVLRKRVLKTTPLFEFLYENKGLDKKRLAATAQNYLAEGLLMIAEENACGRRIVFSGGCAYNSIMSGFMLRKGVQVNELVPAGDGGISFGQACFVSAYPWD